MGLQRVVLICALTPTAAWGQAYVASDPYQYPHPTISSALAVATVGDTITITAGLYPEQLEISRDITLAGDGSELVTVEHSGSGQGVIVLDDGVALTLSGITLTSPDRRGVFGNFANDLDLSDVVFDGTTAASNGGGIFLSEPGSVQLDQVVFSNTSAAASGGGLYLSSSTPTSASLYDVTFTSTTANASGGGVWASGVDLSCVGCAFEGTTASTSGGGIFHNGGGSLSLTDSTLEGTTASVSGGGLYASQLSELTVSNSTLCSTLANTGGAISADVLGQASLSNNVLARTVANDASALDAVSGSWELVNNSIVDADRANGALVFRDGTSAILTNNLLMRNDNGASFGAGASGTLDYNYFFDNVTDLIGGTNGANDVLADPVTGDPQLRSWLPAGNCDSDDLRPAYGSPLIDAGDPGLLDPDGGRSDIGYTGGPGAAPHPDADTDGYSTYLDCDDANPTISPSATELCDGADNDCDGGIDDGAVDAIDWHCDDDQDGEGTADTVITECVQPVGTCSAWVPGTDPLANADCDDLDATVYSQADELCDDVDHNCDGDLHLNAIDTTSFFIDDDGDGFGSLTEALCADVAPPGYADVGGDCDDADPATNPGALDPCGDGLDQDCNGGDGDDASLVSWHPDTDGDGFGDPSVIQPDCNDLSASGYTSPDQATDCDDSNAAVFPGADESCNGVDDDCSGTIDDVPPDSTWYSDSDLDGYGDSVGAAQGICPDEGGPWIDRAGDCDPLDGTIHPDAQEICDGRDNDCDGDLDASDADTTGLVESWPDDDLDGFGACSDDDCLPELRCPDDVGDGLALNALDCNDQNPEQNPAAEEVVGNDIDEDCDGVAITSPREGDDTKEESTGCACSTGPSAPGAGLLLGLLLGTLRRRR